MDSISEGSTGLLMGLEARPTGASVATTVWRSRSRTHFRLSREVLGRLGEDGAQRRLDLVQLVLATHQHGRQLHHGIDPVIGPAHEALFEQPGRYQTSD